MEISYPITVNIDHQQLPAVNSIPYWNNTHFDLKQTSVGYPFHIQITSGYIEDSQSGIYIGGDYGWNSEYWNRYYSSGGFSTISSSDSTCFAPLPFTVLPGDSICVSGFLFSGVISTDIDIYLHNAECGPFNSTYSAIQIDEPKRVSLSQVETEPYYYSCFCITYSVGHTMSSCSNFLSLGFKVSQFDGVVLKFSYNMFIDRVLNNI